MDVSAAMNHVVMRVKRRAVMVMPVPAVQKPWKALA